MINLGSFIKELRNEKNLSQRELARFANISYRQIQRIENCQSDITLGKFCIFLQKFGLDLKVVAKEPDWNVLFNFGLPLNIDNNRKRKYKYKTVVKNIILSSYFLLENKHNVNYMRHYDSFKALLLALRTHYPSKFRKIEDEYRINFSTSFDLNNIQGKHIKLRNICVFNLSSFFP